MLVEFIILTLAAYGFYTAIQMLRGNHLNFKPLNCRFCLGFWFSVFYVLFFNYSIKNFVIYPLAVASGVYFLGLIEDRLTYYA